MYYNLLYIELVSFSINATVFGYLLQITLYWISFFLFNTSAFVYVL